MVNSLNNDCNWDDVIRSYAKQLICIVVFFILLFIVSTLSSCKSVQYVPVETVKKEYVNKTDTFVQKDSVYCHDSVYVIKSGDTITTYKTKFVYKDRWKEVIKIDTFIKTDSIQVPYPVEKKLTKWQQMKMQTGGVFLVFCILMTLIMAVSLFVHRKKN